MPEKWLEKEFREKLEYLTKLYKEEKDPQKKEKIKQTLQVIKVNLETGNDVKYNDIEILLEKDYARFHKTKFVWPLLNEIGGIETYTDTRIENDSTDLSFNEITELLNDFFKNATNKETYDLFAKIYIQNKDNTYFINKSFKKYTGEIIYLDYFKKAYISVFKEKTFRDLTTFAHEYGHAIQFYSNYSFAMFSQEFELFDEIISTFYELICIDYFSNKDFKKPAILTGYKNLMLQISNAKLLQNEISILTDINNECLWNKKDPIENIYKISLVIPSDLTDQLIDEMPGDLYQYVFAFLIATNLFMIYKEDQDKALFLIKEIINLKHNMNTEEYFNKLRDFGITDVDKTNNYKKYVLKRYNSFKKENKKPGLHIFG